MIEPEVLQCYDHAPSFEEFSLNTDAAGFAPPDAFGPFRVLHQIGAGALGPVFRAYQPEQDRLVAVKLFRVDLPPERVHQLVALLETVIAADLHHPGLASPLATGISGVSAYLVQDFVAGDSLDSLLRDSGTLAPVDAVRIAAQIAGALDFAASAGVEHGGLHPRDVIMSPDEPRITGIGVVRALEAVGVSVPIRRPYAAPERVVGDAWDRRADVFSLAAMAFELIWGRRVSGFGDEAVEWVPPPTGADFDALRRLFAQGLARRPDGRFETASAFADALNLAFESAPVPRRAARRRSAPSVAPAVSDDLPLMMDDVPIADPSAELPLIAEPVGRTDRPYPVRDVGGAEGAAHPAEILETLDVVRPDMGPPEETFSVGGETDAQSGDDAGTAAASVRVELLDDERAGSPTTGMRGAPAEATAPIAAHESFSSLALEQSRSAVWPLLLALVVGIAIGFGLSLMFLDREEIARVPEQALTPAAELSPSPSTPIPAASAQDTAPTAPVVPDAGPLQSTPVIAAGGTTPTAPPTPTVPGPALPRTVEPEVGRIIVRSTPSSARVLLDGRDVGQTPMTIRDVSRGTHVVRITRDGFVTQERRVTIASRSAAVTVAIRLPRVPAAPRPRAAVTPTTAPKTGSLVVDSRPAGANVFVDGKLVGRTPFESGEMVVGEYTIRLEMPGYNRWLTTVRVAGGARSRVAASLEQ